MIPRSYKFLAPLYIQRLLLLLLAFISKWCAGLSSSSDMRERAAPLKFDLPVKTNGLFIYLAKTCLHGKTPPIQNRQTMPFLNW
jgi:hypothetical protein